MINNVESTLLRLSEEARDLYLPRSVESVKSVPEPVQFLRDYVSKNIPLLIKGGAKHWPAMKKWDLPYLTTVLGDKEVTVAVTPNGYADAIASKVIDGAEKEFFVLPEERSMPLAQFFSHLESVRNGKCVEKTPGVFYLQKQNSNLTEDFPELLGDIDPTLPWASEAFGEGPTAINLWIGDKRSVTSLHKDPFENIYCVVRGWKEFVLLPPTDRPWLPYKTLPVASYFESSPGVFEICVKDEMDDSSPSNVPWIAIDPLQPDLKTYPHYKNASPLIVRVGPGDLLYLPSLWFHHVRQSDGCIAVNHWYDMSMDIKFAYFQLLEDLSKATSKN